jgi:hypothetical protein
MPLGGGLRNILSGKQLGECFLRAKMVHLEQLKIRFRLN